MEELNLNYNEKNIGLHSKHLIKRTLVSRTEDLVRRMRWKLWHIRNPSNKDPKETFGFRTTDSPPVMVELEDFEKDLWNLVRQVKFKPAGNDLTSKIREDLNTLKNSSKIIVKGDKSRKLYQVNKDSYVKDMTDKITSNYKKGNRAQVEKVNQEAAIIAKKLDLDDRIDALQEGESFISYKDHKPHFPARKETRLLNPSKTNMGAISKHFLDKINVNLRQKTGLNQWKSTNDCIKWFESIPNKRDFKFCKLDIQQFYPSIGQNLLKDSIAWARNYVQISREEEDIIMHCRKSFLFFNGDIFVKKENAEFSVEQGSLDSAEISELVGQFILSQMSEIIPKEQHGIYRDDSLMVLKTTGRGCTKMGERLAKMFRERFCLKITFEANLTVVDFLDVTMSLVDGSYKPYRKDDLAPLYIHQNSNHPPHVKKQMVKMIGRRISDLSSDENIFNQAAPIYNQALRNSGFLENIQFSKRNEEPSKRRKRNVIYFHPPWSDQIETKIGMSFLSLLDKHFPKGAELHKYFSRQKVKVSYSNLPNVSRAIKGINRRVLHPETALQLKGCDCESARSGNGCVEEGGHCLTTNCVYHAKLSYELPHPTTGMLIQWIKGYFGLTKNLFKERVSSHKTTFRYPTYKSSTTLSRKVWELKEATPPINFTLKFSIVKLAQSYTKESKTCVLCQTEKVYIAYADHFSTLNARTELTGKCRHRRKFLLMNWN